jgi:cell division protein FtsB|tara:strand:+ start:1185 stop:1409 length:225 start_codon:yes stop_codon:yes gene_type:complete
MAKANLKVEPTTDVTFQFHQQVASLQEENAQLRQRIGKLTDDFVVLKNEFRRSRQLIQEDMQRVVDVIERRRIL